MKKKYFIAMCMSVTLFILCAAFLCGCFESSPEDDTPKDYTIQYTDDSGVHTITVTYGMPYSMESVPTKIGYDFTGLFDAETGGTQYVSSNGSSLSPFTDRKNMVLFPQFKAKEYTLVLDYQGATITGSRTLSVEYNSLINDLPMNLAMENKIFVGWFTQPNKQGTQVADMYGAIPSKNIVDEGVFDLSDPKGYIYLYAGFKGEEFTVTLYFTDSGAPEEVKVEYGTYISEVQFETRVDGNAVIAWSKKRNDTAKEEIFSGKVTGEMVLYAAEFAPIIDFDSNGGKPVNSVIARAGDSISLPTPVRANYEFMGWKDNNGKLVDYSAMPESSVKLKAEWQAIMIIFDSNGGTAVNNIFEPQGATIVLPTPERDGYIFDGWYDENGEKYESATMPQESVRLKAKWRNVKTYRLIDSNSKVGGHDHNDVPMFGKNCHVLDLTDLFNKGVRSISVSVHYQSGYCYRGTSGANNGACKMSWYSQQIAVDDNLLWSYSETYSSHGDEVWGVWDRTATIKLASQYIYICRYAGWNSSYQYYYWKDFYVEIESFDI